MHRNLLPNLSFLTKVKKLQVKQDSAFSCAHYLGTLDLQFLLLV